MTNSPVGTSAPARTAASLRHCAAGRFFAHDFPISGQATANEHEVVIMNEKRIGRRTIALHHPPSVHSCAAVGGRMEGKGPLAAYFDVLGQDSFFG